MKQVFLSGQGQVSVMSAPVPARLENSILVRNQYSLISTGTEGAAVTRRSGLLGIYEKAISSGDRVQQVWSMAKSQGARQTYKIVRNKLSDYTAVGYSSVGKVIEVENSSLPFRAGDTVACMGVGYANHAELIDCCTSESGCSGPKNCPNRTSCIRCFGVYLHARHTATWVNTWRESWCYRVGFDRTDFNAHSFRYGIQALWNGFVQSPCRYCKGNS